MNKYKKTTFSGGLLLTLQIWQIPHPSITYSANQSIDMDYGLHLAMNQYLQKGGDPSPASARDALLRLHPSH